MLLFPTDAFAVANEAVPRDLLAGCFTKKKPAMLRIARALFLNTLT